jgi:sulfur carrier protein ThiS
MEVSDDGCLSDVIQSINIPVEIRPVFFVNHKRCAFDKKLSDGDEIKIVSLIMGG